MVQNRRWKTNRDGAMTEEHEHSAKARRKSEKETERERVCVSSVIILAERVEVGTTRGRLIK
jgi:hypothetical protein